MDKSTDGFTEDDQWKIIKISAATCLALGLTDLMINLISRTNKERRLRKELEMRPFTITPESEIIKQTPPPIEEESDEEATDRLKREKEMEKHPREEFFIDEVESAVF